MSTVIRNGTVVTADLSYSADILVDNGVITDIGDNLSGGTELDATDCYIMPGAPAPDFQVAPPWWLIFVYRIRAKVCWMPFSAGTTNPHAPTATIPFIWQLPGGVSKSSMT